MCGSTIARALQAPFKGKPLDQLQRVEERFLPPGLPTVSGAVKDRRRGKKPPAPTALGGYVSEYDRRTALGG